MDGNTLMRMRLPHKYADQAGCVTVGITCSGVKRPQTFGRHGRRWSHSRAVGTAESVLPQEGEATWRDRPLSSWHETALHKHLPSNEFCFLSNAFSPKETRKVTREGGRGALLRSQPGFHAVVTTTPPLVTPGSCVQGRIQPICNTHGRLCRSSSDRAASGVKPG